MPAVLVPDQPAAAVAQPDIVVVDDAEANRTLLEAVLVTQGYRVHSDSTGDIALPYLRSLTRPVVALIDWEMPGTSGPEICTALRADQAAQKHFLILLTGRSSRSDIIAGLRSGANDYVTKPFDPAELMARVRIAWEMVALQRSLADRVAELERALAENRQLQGLLPICSYCKNIRDEANYWQRVESYVANHSHAQFSHGICPTCLEKHFGDIMKDD